MSFLQPDAPKAVPAAPPPPKPTSPDVEAAAVAARRAIEQPTGGRALTMLGAASPVAASGQGFLQKLLGAVSR